MSSTQDHEDSDAAVMNFVMTKESYLILYGYGVSYRGKLLLDLHIHVNGLAFPNTYQSVNSLICFTIHHMVIHGIFRQKNWNHISYYKYDYRTPEVTKIIMKTTPC